MNNRIIVDTGPLVALLGERDARHQWVKGQMATIRPPMLTCEAVISETCFLLGRNGKSRVAGVTARQPSPDPENRYPSDVHAVART
uniref:PIN domain-containing protein n=1 Tax=Candidatus Kentrum sp. LPFa TaxID=2126335 RepID=A0A450WDL8_9GAMM|nr:MAG: hypothetical protein BECKLPF1236B_GA0070989_107312 [Candidatus Kentron sp. LPFa]